MVLFIKIGKALFVRLALLIHTTLAVWRVVVIKGDNSNTGIDNQWWMLGLAAVPFVIEGLITIVRRGGDEFKW